MSRLKRASSLAAAAVVAFSSLLSVGLVPLASAASGSDACAWTGSGDGTTFSDATNWSSCSAAAPVSGDSLVFDNSTQTSDTTLSNDLSNLSVGSITFSGSSLYTFVIDGNQITVTGGVTLAMTNGLTPVFNNSLVISGNQTFDLGTSSGQLSLLSGISGSGNIALNGTGGELLVAESPSYTGTITSSGTNVVDLQNSTGNYSLGGLVIAGHSVVILDNEATGDGTFNVPLSLGGDGTAYTSANGHTGAVALSNFGTSKSILSGAITLTSDVQVTGDGVLSITGTQSGSYTITPAGGENVTLQTGSGTQQSGTVTTTIAAGDNQVSTPLNVAANNILILDGSRGAVTVSSGGVLKGTGTAGALNVLANAIIAPGHSPGCLNSANLTVSGTYQAEIGGVDPCTGYDQLKVTGTVDVTGGTLSVSSYNDFKPVAGQAYKIIDNDGSDAVTGTFSGLSEGSTFKLDDGSVLAISYKGGDGNDVVLTVQAVPTTPDTGFALVSAHPLATLATTVLAAGALVGLAQRNRKGMFRR